MASSVPPTDSTQFNSTSIAAERRSEKGRAREVGVMMVEGMLIMLMVIVMPMTAVGLCPPALSSSVNQSIDISINHAF